MGEELKAVAEEVKATKRVEDKGIKGKKRNFNRLLNKSKVMVVGYTFTGTEVGTGKEVKCKLGTLLILEKIKGDTMYLQVYKGKNKGSKIKIPMHEESCMKRVVLAKSLSKGNLYTFTGVLGENKLISVSYVGHREQCSSESLSYYEDKYEFFVPVIV